MAASALAYVLPLAFILENDDAGRFNGREDKIGVTWRLVKYFENGEAGPVK